MLENKYQNYLLVIIFLLIILFPISNSILGMVKDIKSSENRKMSNFPTVNINYLDIYPSEFTKYFNDNFSIRSRCIEAYNTFILNFYHKSPIPDQMVFGKDGFLFLGGNELTSYRGKNVLSNEELTTFKQELEYRKEYLKKRGCKFYVLVAPIKAAIYTNKMPENVIRVYEKSWGEQLINYLEKNSSVNTVNLYDRFKAIKDTVPLYLKLDNHWNSIGAYYGVSEFLNHLKKDFPLITNKPLTEYIILPITTKNGDIVQMLSNNESFQDTAYHITPKIGFEYTAENIHKYPCIDGFPYCSEYELHNRSNTPSDSTKPKLLIISDSFGGAFYPFASEHFRETAKIFDSWQYKLNEPIVESEKPDIMILIMLESNIRNLLRYTSCPNIKKNN
jgi:alginate O-acetyltransferase complex protein AlgJ